MPPHILFLPGAGGSPAFWRPLGDLLPAAWRKTYLGWPGLGNQPHDPAVQGFDDLVALAARQIDRHCVVAAQSMGGIVAVRLALANPEKVRGLVLTVTSGDIDMAKHAPSDWRGDYISNFPDAARWIMFARADHGAEIPNIKVPTLLIWGDADPISPVSVGEELSRLLPNARLHIVRGGTHDLVQENAAEIAPLFQAHVVTLVRPPFDRLRRSGSDPATMTARRYLFFPPHICSYQAFSGVAAAIFCAIRFAGQPVSRAMLPASSSCLRASVRPYASAAPHVTSPL